jgi:polysaccharide export outer membrane protein
MALLLTAGSLGCRGIVARPGEMGPPLVGPPGSFHIRPGLTAGPGSDGVPTEKDKSTLPEYVIAPPDILLIEALKIIPKPPYHIEPLDVLQVLVAGAIPDWPISGQVAVDPSGWIDLGPVYGKVQVGGLTLEEVKASIIKHLKETLANPEVSVNLVEAVGQQSITGEHLVAPDGTVNLGTYGMVCVAGMTIDQATAAIEKHLSQTLEAPKISISIFAYNSQVYYIILEGAGQGDNVTRLPITGNETVLDAISQINGLSRLSSKRIWIARPTPNGMGCDEILPVNWGEITKQAATATNYQILPGDRVFIAESKLIAIDSYLNKLISPFERFFGFTLLGAQDVQTFNRFPTGISGGAL